MKFLDKHSNAVTRAATILSKIVEVAYAIGATGLIALLIGFVMRPGAKMPALAPGEEITIRGFSLVCGNPDGFADRTAFGLVLLDGALSMILMWWIFRNAYLILRTTQGLTKFSRGATPFQKDNVRMLREIGIAFFAMPVVRLIISLIAVAVMGPDRAEVSMELGEAIVGILMLCLSQCFAQGVQMQQDVDGLV